MSEEIKTRTIFFSRSLENDAKEFCDKIKRYLTGVFGFNGYITIGDDYLKHENLYESVKREIRNSDFVICCFTADMQTKDNKFFSKSSVYMEFAFANYIGKQIITFVEKGVEINTMVNNATNYVIISKDVLLNKLNTNIKESNDFHKRTESLIINSIDKETLDYYAKKRK
jgi:hypothetical protein